MAGVGDLRELFLHDLGDIMFAERRIVDMLGELVADTKDEELRAGFERHLDQTRTHVANLERAFEVLDEKPRTEHCPGIEGIRAEREEHIGDLAEPLHDVFNAGAAARTEHYEIAAYEGLIPKGEAIEANEAVALLWDNLKDEKETLHELNTVMEKLVTVRGPGSAMA